MTCYGPTMPPWPPLRSYEDWNETCDTLHAHTQVLGKLAVALAPAEPQLQHAALRLTARGWETSPLPAPDGSGTVVVALDLRSHEAVVEAATGVSDMSPWRPIAPSGWSPASYSAPSATWSARSPSTRGPRRFSWSVPLDQDDLHARYDPGQVDSYFGAATHAALVLAAFRAPYRGRSTPVNAWWGSFDLAVSLFSGLPAAPPSDDFIMRNAMDAQEVAVGWWPGDSRFGRAAFYAYAHPPHEGFGKAKLSPGSVVWEPSLGEYILEWNDVCQSSDPGAAGLEFARSGVPPRLHRVRLGPGVAGERGGNSTPGGVSGEDILPEDVPDRQRRAS